MPPRRRLLSFLAALAWLGSGAAAIPAAHGHVATAAPRAVVPIVSGDARQWHRATLTFDGPRAAEDGALNPFRDVRLDVTFVHRGSGDRITVPGFFAADGMAAESSATSGTKWRVHFAPPRTGEWDWRASCRTGTDVAIAADSASGRAWLPLDGTAGTLTITVSDARVPDFRARGALRYVGQRYLRFAGDGTAFLKGGVDSPETLLGYADFDGTFRDLDVTHVPPAPSGIISLPALENGLHRYAPHVADWRPGDPTWKGGRGKGLIGGLNYLAAQGVNSVYFLTMNVNGDGRNAWPWTDPRVRDRFDASKLDQWDIVFSHMTHVGIALHVVMQETENDHLLDSGDLGAERKLYYRELVARFAHHPAVTWNLGEENVQSVEQQRAEAAWLNALDPYHHPIVIHNDHWHAKNLRETFDPLLGFAPITGTALQDFHWNDIDAHVRHYVRASAEAGHPWVVAADEMGGAPMGTLPDADDPGHDRPRIFGLWGTLMAGGAGVEWYFGWQNGSPHSDLSAETWRTREDVFRQTRIALDFFQRHVPFDRMQPLDDVAVGRGVSCLAAPGEVYLFHLPNGGATRFDFGQHTGPFEVRWFDPRRGGELREGSVRRVRGPGLAWTGEPPAEPERDWVALVRRIPETAPSTQFPQGAFAVASPDDLGVHPVGLEHAITGWRVALGRDAVDKVVVLRRGVLVHRGPLAESLQPLGSISPSFAGTSLGLSALDLARVGHLYLSGGRWGDRQLIPESWVDGVGDGGSIDGLSWWTNGERASGPRRLPHAPAATFVALGRHHNVVIVVPEWEMVIVRLGEDDARGDTWAVLDDFLRRLGMAVSPLAPAE